MHMADALISPVVGGTMLVATAAITSYSVNKIRTEDNENKIPLMGVMGAFVFAAQMINFSIPGTGSSGHLGGGIMLAALLGPYGGFLTMLSILLIQSLFFADGGLLALGCNVVNLGFVACMIAYPLIYKRILRKEYTTKKIFIASILSAVIGLQLGALGVVVETTLSGVTELPFTTFIMFMQPIHLLIGIVEGVVTAFVLNFIWKARPELLEKDTHKKKSSAIGRNIITVILIGALAIGGLLSLFASSNPDGLEWSIGKVSGVEEIVKDDVIMNALKSVQEKTAFLPDYAFKSGDKSQSLGTTVSGVTGVALTLGILTIISKAIKVFKARKRNEFTKV